MKYFPLAAICGLALFVTGCHLGPKVPPMSVRPKVVLTFDDGFVEHYTTVAPILEKYGLRGTFNIIVGRVGKPGYMNWRQIRSLAKRGHAIENHTYSHTNLVALVKSGSQKDFAHELEFSCDKIAAEVGRRPTFLCYPYSQSTWVTDQLVRDYWLSPMDCKRRNFGEGTVPRTETGAGAYINACIADHVEPIDILTHGVTATGGGWRPFPNAEVFEEHIKEIREMQDQGKIAVVLYRDAVR